MLVAHNHVAAPASAMSSIPSVRLTLYIFKSSQFVNGRSERIKMTVFAMMAELWSQAAKRLAADGPDVCVPHTQLTQWSTSAAQYDLQFDIIKSACGL